jgi:hypothetical protein
MRFPAIRNRMRYANVVTTLALVFAMTGGAYAVTGKGGGPSGPSAVIAAKGGGAGGPSAPSAAIAATKKGKSKAKALRGPAGPRGPEGKQGPAGPQGPAGANGKDGANGSNGEKGVAGETGLQGNAGKSVVLGKINTGVATCKEQGGVSIEVEGNAASKQSVCNGEPGVIHPGTTLPKGASETGTWIAMEGEPEEVEAAISFPIPLSATAAEHTTPVYVPNTDTTLPAGCQGSAAEPEAEEGHLCLFQGPAHYQHGAEFGEVFFKPGVLEEGVGTTGTRFVIASQEGEHARFVGTWAVTAE